MTAWILSCFMTWCSPADAQRFGWQEEHLVERDIFPGNAFTFCRARYSSSGRRGRRGRRGGGRWLVDYPEADQNFSLRLSQLTTLNVNKDENGEFVHAIVGLDEPDLFKYPFIYVLEVGAMSLTEPEREGLRAYLLRGGFLLVDDFWGDYAWENWVFEISQKLENLAVSSVAFSDSGDSTASDWLIDRFFEHAKTAAGPTRIRDLVNHRQLRRQLIGLCASWAVVLFVAILMIGRWDLEWIGAELFARSSPPPIDLAVEPGDIRVRHGADQVVWLTTGATSETVAIRWRIEKGAWVSNALQPSRSENVYYHTFTDIQSAITYQIQAAGSQSPLYRIDVWTPPEVAWIDAVYRYPEYTGQPSRSISAVGDIEGPIGTTVELTVHVNQPVATAELVFTFTPPLKLDHHGPNTLVGEIEIGADDTFRVALQSTAGNRNVDDRPYAITARWDEVPEIRIAYPAETTQRRQSKRSPSHSPSKTTMAYGNTGFSMKSPDANRNAGHSEHSAGRNGRSTRRTFCPWKTWTFGRVTF
jgi:hypothetical protein